MCGRFVRKSTMQEIAEEFGAGEVLCDLTPSFNVAPRQPVAVIKSEGHIQLVTMQWGLVPPWAKDEKIANKLINARAETIDQKPSFRNSFKNRRCLIVADGFFEWKKSEGRKVPEYIYLKTGKPFGMAGLYEQWKKPDGEIITTCTIITTVANEFMKGIHHRMPVIVDPESYDAWLDPSTDSRVVKSILKPSDSELMTSHEVSTEVNSPANDSVHCIEPHSLQSYPLRP